MAARPSISLPRWRAVVNVAGTGDDCFKWAILAGMHPVDVHADCRGKYVEHMGKYDFSSLHIPTPLQAVGSFALRNNMSINVYGWTMTMRWSIPSASHPHLYQIDMWIYYCSNVMMYSTTPPLGTLADWLGDRWATMNTLSNAVDDVYTPTWTRSCWMPMLLIVAMHKGPNFPWTQCVDSPISRNNY